MNDDYTILVVDDQDDFRDYLGTVLCANGFLVEEANSGAEALLKIGVQPPDLVLLDVVMPHMTGLELLSKLRVKDSEYAVIMITGNESLADAKKSMELGAYSYISKPLNWEDLKEQIYGALSDARNKKDRIRRLAKLEEEVHERTDQLEIAVRILKSQSRRLDVVLNGMEEGLFAIDEKKRIAFMNTTAEKILGVRFSECLGKQLSTAIPDVLVAKKLSTLIGRAPATGENILSLCRDGGGFSFYHVNTQKINDENGADIGRVVTLLDRTENIGAMQMRTSFLSVVAHELRTPITVIKNYLEILSSNEDREIVDGLKVSCGRLELLVGKLISLAALSGASFFVNLCNTHVVNLLARCVKKLKIEIAGKNVTVKIDNKLRSPKIVTDSQLLILALTSLIDNAVKFNADGGTVSICLDEEIQSDRTAVLSIAISDQGSGISDIARAHLFESFSQGESHLTRHFGGLGTGLFLARRAVELLKGRIEVDSVEGRGSCFTIFLPLQRATKPSPIIKKL